MLAKRIGARKGLFNSNASVSVNIQLIGTIGREKKTQTQNVASSWHLGALCGQGNTQRHR